MAGGADTGRSTSPPRPAGCCRPACCASLGVVPAGRGWGGSPGSPGLRRERVRRAVPGVQLGEAFVERAELRRSSPPWRPGLRHPLDHYWSLSVEEQFYWVWPLGCSSGWCAFGRRGTRWSLLRLLAVLYVVERAAAPGDRLDLGGPTWPIGPHRRERRGDPRRRPPWRAGGRLARRPATGVVRGMGCGVGGGSCLVALGVACVTFPAGSGLAYRGASCSIGLLQRRVDPRVAGRRATAPALSWRPLVGDRLWSATGCTSTTGRCSCWSTANGGISPFVALPGPSSWRSPPR